MGFIEGMPMSFDKLERSIKAYVSTPGAMDSKESLSFQTLPVVEDIDTDVSPTDDSEEVGASGVGGGMGMRVLNDSKQKPKEQVDPASVIYAIPELASLGRVFRSSAPVPLTESETEYVVTCVKHIFESHIVLQFKVQNTIDDQRLENVTIMLESDGD